jgi:hypothetical protein
VWTVDIDELVHYALCAGLSMLCGDIPEPIHLRNRHSETVMVLEVTVTMFESNDYGVEDALFTGLSVLCGDIPEPIHLQKGDSVK